MGKPGTSETTVEMAAESDPAMWATLQLVKETDPKDQPKTVGDAYERIAGIFKSALAMAMRQAADNAASGTNADKPHFTATKTAHSRHPWRVSFDDGEHPTIDAPIKDSTLPGRAGVGVCQFHMLDVENGGIGEDDRDSEQGANIALIATAPELLADSIAARDACAWVLDWLGEYGRLAYPWPESVARKIDAAVETLERLDRTIDNAVDVAWIDTQ